MSTPPPVVTPEPTQEKKPKGCWFYGCLGVAVVCLLGVVGSLLTIRYAYKKVTAAIQEYTEPEAAPLPELRITAQDGKALEERMKRFLQAAAGGETSSLLELTGDELNHLFAKGDPSGFFARAVRLRLEGTNVLAQVSVPMEKLGPLSLPGRFLNGEASLGLSYADGRLGVAVNDFKFHGKSLPPELMTALRAADFSKGLQDNPDLSRMLSRFERIAVEEGRLHLTRQK